MNEHYVLLILLGYFVLLFFVSKFSTKTNSNSSFFIADRSAPWPLVAYGMIGVAISGMTFVSVPGKVLGSQFSYFQLVIGYSIGLLVIAFVILPRFYKIKAITIYSYLEHRFGKEAKLTGTLFFLFAQVAMASIRLYLMVSVMQILVFDSLNFPIWLSTLIILLLIFLYTYKGGIKTVIVTDTLQTTFLIVAVLATIWIVSSELGFSFAQISEEMANREISTIFLWSFNDPNNIWKMIGVGALLTIMSNGLDQSIMQKHLTCKSIKDAQKNIVSLAVVLLVINLLFLYLGGTLQLYSEIKEIPLPSNTDELYPLLVSNHLGPVVLGFFVIGIAAAAYSSADSSLTGLTTSYCVDILGMDNTTTKSHKKRYLVHFLFTIVIFLFILVVHSLNDEAIIDTFIKITGFVYGPLMGLFLFGFFTKRTIKGKWIMPISIACLLFVVALYNGSPYLFNGYKMGHEILIVNFFFTFIVLYGVSFLNDNFIKK